MTAKLVIRSNRKPRHLQCYEDLPQDARSDFDYILGDNVDNCAVSDCRFVMYKGNWYDVYDKMRVTGEDGLKGWDCYENWTYFSGVVFKFVDANDGPSVICGWYYLSDSE